MQNVTLMNQTGMRGDVGQGQHKQQDELQNVAEQFEALFIEELLKTSRNSSLNADLFDSEYSDTYKEMLHREYALSISQKASLGIAEALTNQFGSKIGTPKS